MPNLIVLLSLGALAAVAFCGGAQADAARDSQTWVISGPPPPPKGCDLRHARRVDLVAVGLHTERYHHSCVRVRGLVSFRTLYAGLTGYYLAGPKEGHVANQDAERYRVGLYVSDADWTKKIGGKVVSANVAGIVMTCGDLYHAEKNVLMVTGWCHQNDGPFLAVADLRTRPAHIRRLVGESNRRRLGNLRFAGADWRDRAAVVAIAQRWIFAIQNNDLAGFRALSGGEFPAEEEVAFHAVNSPFAIFRGGAALPQMALFYPPTDFEDQQTSNFPDPKAATDIHDVGIFCFCRVKDCGALWPISDFDIAAAPGRAYVCGDVWSGDGQMSVTLSLDDDGIIEPAPR